VRAFTTFQLTGDLVQDSTVDLVAGANLVGYDTLKPLRASDFVKLITLQGGKVMKVSTLNENGQWQHFIPGFTRVGSAMDYTMTQGHSYMVFATTGGVITYPAA
jgi:UTP:GlnB (protein PII) uridylyltransferase